MTNNCTEWIIPCSPKVYDCESAFNELIRIDWKQSKLLSGLKVDDTVYIYTSSPVMHITHQCVVNKVNVPTLEIDDSKFYIKDEDSRYNGLYVELQCIRQFDILEALSFHELKKHGIKGNIQGPMRVTPELSNHLYTAITQQNSIDRFDSPDIFYINSSNRYGKLDFDDHSGITILRPSDYYIEEKAKKSQKEKVKSKTVLTVQKNRDPYVAEFAKRRAKGICQLCGNKAPFVDKNGVPYLESHHIVWLSDGGQDTIDNTVALCPNCHKKMHILNDPKDVNLLKQKNQK